MKVLEVIGAHKRFDKVQALRGATLELAEGELLGLLGPNGAGKTTLVRAIAGRVRLDQGSIRLLGRTLEPSSGREDLGVVPQEIAVYPLLSARENLEVWGRLHGAADLATRVAWALEWTGLADRATEPVKSFSGGMRRRLNIACGVLHRPKVILLDEPTVGVDPQSRERIYDMLLALRAEGASLVLTTHQLEEAESRCDRIVIIDHGEVIASGSLAALVEQTVGSHRRVTLHLDHTPREPLPGFTVNSGGTLLHTQVKDVATEMPSLLGVVERAGCKVLDLEVRSPSLHSVFLHLTGRDLRE